MDDDLRVALWAVQRQLPTLPDADYHGWALDRESTAVQADRIRGHVRDLSGVRRVALVVSDVRRDADLLQTLESFAEQISPPSGVVVAVQDRRRADWVRRSALKALRNCCPLTIVEQHHEESEVGVANRVLHTVESDFVAWVSAGDILSSVAIASIQRATFDFPEAKVIYSDEDWIDDLGTRMRPRFKTAWDPDAQLGIDFLGRLCAIDVRTAREAGGFRDEFGIAAHYDLNCRVALPLLDSEIRHIPAVLYHRRVVLNAESPRSQHPIDEYLDAGRAAVKEAVSGLVGEAVRVVPSPLGSFVHRVCWPLPNPLPKVSILIPTRDRAELVENCVRGILEVTDYANMEVIILDNDSCEARTHALFDRLSLDPRVRVFPVPGPFNYSRINNQGVAASTGEIVVLMNNDVEVIGSGWLKEMVAQAIRPEIGCVGTKLLFGDKRIQHAGVLFQEGPLAMHAFRLRGPLDLGEDGQLAGLRSYLAVTAACLAIRRSVFDEVGGFDSVNLQIAYNDVDLCLRVHDAGYRNVCTPYSPLFHLESASRGANDSPEKQKKDRAELAHAANRWRDKFEHDPFNNPQVRYTWDHGATLSRKRFDADGMVRAR